MKNEIWKDVKWYERLYQVSNLGRIKRLKHERDNLLTGGKSIYKEQILKQTLQNNCYLFVSLYKKGTQKRVSIHRLIAIAFIDNNEKKPTVNHKNGIKTDNLVKNLEWCTQSENIQHAHKNGFGKSKLNIEDVLEIRRSLNLGVKQRIIAKKLNVKKCVIADISANRTWWYVS